DGGARVVGEHEDGHVIGRAFAPPSLPLIVGPGAADGAEHVAAHDPGAQVFEATPREVVVDATPRAGGIAALILVKHPRAHEPVVQRFAADPEGVVRALVGTSTVAVDRD